jgi:hypothetical protein
VQFHSSHKYSSSSLPYNFPSFDAAFKPDKSDYRGLEKRPVTATPARNPKIAAGFVTDSKARASFPKISSPSTWTCSVCTIHLHLFPLQLSDSWFRSHVSSASPV